MLQKPIKPAQNSQSAQARPSSLCVIGISHQSITHLIQKRFIHTLRQLHPDLTPEEVYSIASDLSEKTSIHESCVVDIEIAESSYQLSDFPAGEIIPVEVDAIVETTSEYAPFLFSTIEYLLFQLPFQGLIVIDEHGRVKTNIKMRK